MVHVLFVGGTGMLADVSKWHAQRQHKVSIIGRDKMKMQKIETESSHKNNLYPLYVDYRNLSLLEEQILSAIAVNGPIQQVVAWVRSDALESLQVIIKIVSSKAIQQWDLFHVLSSKTNVNEIKMQIDLPLNCEYKQIQLGFKIENNQSRWLTNHEISHGVIDAIESNNLSLHIVGQVTPKERRP
ncbi:short-chain dehydrogenase [Peribacillus butanolivorans]|uniref:short-chain dehydrogenase n=1 Tax=Peribacillus butanolivorans TaxID=421767 RepID=UPI003D2DAD91